jgi:hypothetical protein
MRIACGVVATVIATRPKFSFVAPYSCRYRLANDA